MIVREPMPLRLHATVTTPDGLHRRYGPDSPPGDVMSGESFSTTMPGGFEQGQFTITRNPVAGYSDLEELSNVQLRGVGGEIAFEGRLEGSPRSSADQTVTVTLSGWQSHLLDNPSAREVFVDIDFTSWQGPSVNRRYEAATATLPFDADDPQTVPDAAGAPTLQTGITGPWSRTHTSEAWYDAKGIPLHRLYYAWERGPVVDAVDPNWGWQAYLASDDQATSSDASGNLVSAGPGSGELLATTSTRDWAAAILSYFGAAGDDGVLYGVNWTCLAAYGDHGLPLYGSEGATSAKGVLASDVVAYVLSRWAPKIGFTTGTYGTIQPSTYVIPHLPFTDPTTVSDMVQQTTRFDLEDWAVWPGPTFYMNPRGSRGRRWRSRVRPAALTETGPTMDRLYNGVIVTYTDVTGVSRTVGPPGSGSTFESSSLVDSDPENPLNEDGSQRLATVKMGTSVAGAATQVGMRYLQEQKLVSTAGQAQLVGYVEDADTGIRWPAWMVLAGDWVTFSDASDTSFRRIVRTNYNGPTRTNNVDLDSPPDGMQQLLERLSIALVRAGFS